MKNRVSSLRAETALCGRALALLHAPFSSVDPRPPVFLLLAALAGALGTLTAVPMPAMAQSAAPALPETVVTATRVSQPLSDLLADVSVIDRQTIERAGVSGVADLLARLPGIEIARNGGMGTVSSVYLRGAESRFTAVYVDGARVDSQATGGALWEQIPLSQIDRIEVLRGPAAAVYGSDAIGGVIQLFTRKGDGKAAPYVGIGLGNFNTRRIEAGISGSAGEERAFDYSLGVAHDESNGFDSQVGPGHNPDRDSYRSTSGHAKLGLQITPDQRVDATLLASKMNSGYDAFDYSPRAPVDDRNLNRLQTAGVAWSSQWTKAYSTKLSVTDSTSRYESSPSHYLTQTQLRGYLFQNEYRIGAHLFTAALERREDKLYNPALDAFSTTIERDRSQDGVALGYGYHSGPHTVQVNLRHDRDSEFGGYDTGSVAYGFAITPQWRVTASAGTAFRAPTLYQRFSAYGTADLQPEDSRNVEAGLHYAQGASSAGLVVYRNRVNNLIAFDYNAKGCASFFGCYANTERAVYEGITLSGAHRIGDVTLRGSLDLQDPRDLDSGKQLAQRARRHATLGADWRVGSWTVGAEVQLSGKRYANAANTQVLPGYGVVNLSASTPMARDFTLVARVDNLADKEYQLVRGYATLGRSVYVGLKWAPR